MYLYVTKTKAQISCAVTVLLISLRGYHAADLDLCFRYAVTVLLICVFVSAARSPRC